MPRTPPDQAPRRTASKGRGCCLTGCAGIAGILFISFLVVFLRAGTYQPAIPSVPPLPNPNGLDDIVAAGNLYKATGGDSLLYPPNPKPVPLKIRMSVVQANQPALA